MKQLLVILLVLGLFALPGHLSSATVPGTGQRFLDLPDGFGLSEEEEDEPELIEFYTDEYEGDAWFFCLDRSSSMGQQTASGQTKFEVLKRETVKALSSLTKRSVASVVFYNADLNPLVIGDPPPKMDAAGKARIIGLVSSTPISAGSCLYRGMLKALDLANKTQNDYRQVILTADGRTHCSNGETDPDRIFNMIMARNIHRIPINSVYTGPMSGDDWTKGKPLLERLSRSTNGKFRIAQ